MGKFFKTMRALALFPGRPSWTAAEIPDLSGKVALVTGGNSGIGKETCIELAKHGAKVYMAARNKERALAALEDIKKKVGENAKVEWLELDLSDLASVRNAAAKVLAQEEKLHLYFQNAGLMGVPDTKTKDGFEMQWGTNVVGHFALTKALLPLLLSTAKTSKEGDVRVVHISSAAHYNAPRDGIHFEDTSLKGQDDWKRYGQSKLGNILMSKELARLHGGDGIYSLSVHPGFIDTDWTRSHQGGVRFSYLLTKWLMLSISKGALTQLYAGTSPQVVEKKQNGAFFIPFAREVEPSDHALNAELATALWKHLETQTEPQIEPQVEPRPADSNEIILNVPAEAEVGSAVEVKG